jgi:hypothetical protein
MSDGGFNESIVRWYQYYLSNRVATTELQGVKVSKALTRGTPQGGVLSPLCWNIPFDELIQEINQGAIKIGFADDLMIFVCSSLDLIHTHTLVNLKQQAINKAVAWALLPGRRCESKKLTSKIGFFHILEYP